MEYELEVTFRPDPSIPGEAFVENLFDWFNSANPDSNALVRLDRDGMIRLTFLTDARSPHDAWASSEDTFVRGMEATPTRFSQGLLPTAIKVSLLEDLGSQFSSSDLVTA